jgi:serine protease AprX
MMPLASRSCRLRVPTMLALAAFVFASAPPPADAQLALDRPGLARLLAAHDAGAVVRAVATFAAPPEAARVGALRGLGLAVQPMRHVPLALVVGPVATLESAVALGFAADVWPDEPIELFDTASSDALGAAATRAAGRTGAGVTVAVVDSGCDASHPDLADHVAHNVKLYSGEYVNVRPDGSNTIVVPVEMGPYQNSDLAGGHGTHVAGIIAADSTTDPSGGRLGVAPDAELVCYSIGEVLFTTAVVTAYDHLLDQPDLWGVDVVNNSWGNSFRPFDPRDPVAVVTKAVADLGVVVVFAAGNSGYSNAEMSLNPFSQAPWVLSVAAGTLDHRRGDFSSNGLVFDNSEPVQVGAGGHTAFAGDRIGVYHPDVTAPGVSISSTCSTLGVAVLACPPYGNRSASGTSMAAPHVAGAAAVLLEAQPELSTAQLRAALEATATPVLAADGFELPFWQVGFGYVDLPAAVSLVTAKKPWAKDLSRAHARAEARVLASDGFAVVRSDLWTYDAPRLAVGGSDQRTFSTVVGLSTTHLKVTLSHPSLAVLGENGMSYTVTVYDAGGQPLGTTTEAPTGAGTAGLFVDLGALGFTVVPGEFTFEVRGELALSDPDTIDSESLLGRMVTLQVAQLRPD